MEIYLLSYAMFYNSTEKHILKTWSTAKQLAPKFGNPDKKKAKSCKFNTKSNPFQGSNMNLLYISDSVKPRLLTSIQGRSDIIIKQFES